MERINNIKKETEKENIRKINFEVLPITQNYIISMYNNETELINYYVLSKNELINLFNNLFSLSENKLLSKEFIKSFIDLKTTVYL